MEGKMTKCLYAIGDAIFWVWDVLCFGVTCIVMAFGFLAYILGAILWAYLEIDAQRDATQWYYGTGKYAKR